MQPTADLAGARAATERLLAHLDGLGAVALQRPSLLPGWSAAHVVAHLAGNAWSHVRMLDGCLVGEVREQYAGGAEARAAAIEALAADPLEAVADHRRACAALAERWDAMTPAHWERPVQRLDEQAHPARPLARARWREVEVHGVDTATGWSWSPAFLLLLLDELAARPDLPALVLEASGEDGRPPRTGDAVAAPAAAVVPGRWTTALAGGGGQVVRGTADALARWLSGRSAGEGLTSDAPLPVLPPWR